MVEATGEGSLIMGTPYTKGGQKKWLEQDVWSLPNKHYRRSHRYYEHLYKAWPEWCANDPEFKRIYKEAERRREAGEDVQVDHVVPIINPLVCGLHVPWNLEIIGKHENLSKGNRWWPDHPFDNQELFATGFAPYQLSLT